ncbi:DUF5388 domain-containing protein [Limosilactobacillus reuteri]|uniref:DUF5388 domain-containing protein n=1 Tax=Limosilactobacillus reuteri TaxID=1598 RepID=UPI000A2EA789|nr:DUF5388 domain-containing protein [Limosilactobacillus reuteri]OTA85935.1 hypothetical protein BHL84_08455 [Limosilactobacillus reuteri]
MYKEYGEIKFKGMDNVRKSDVDFLKGLIAYVESQERDTTRYISEWRGFREYIKKDKDRLSYSITSNILSNKATINKLKALKTINKAENIGSMLDTVVNRYIDELSLKDKEKYCKSMRIFEAEVEEKYGNRLM